MDVISLLSPQHFQEKNTYLEGGQLQDGVDGHSKSFSDPNPSFDLPATAISTNFHSQKSSFEVNTLKTLQHVKALHIDIYLIGLHHFERT